MSSRILNLRKNITTREQSPKIKMVSKTFKNIEQIVSKLLKIDLLPTI